jgi:hypothetical protein
MNEKLTKKYIKKEIYDDHATGIRVIIRETGYFFVFEEGYSLKISTRQSLPKFIHRDYIIEHHVQPPHNFPHLQFKFTSEEIGQFRLRIDIKNQEEYKKAILGFVYKIKDVISTLEESKPGITSEILNVRQVNSLKIHGDFLTKKIEEGLKKYSIDFDQEKNRRSQIRVMQGHPLFIGFIGKKNISTIQAELKKKKISTAATSAVSSGMVLHP